MKLHRLSLRNFRQHQNTDLYIPPGLTAIIGPNGAGKSSMLEALSFAMFGTKALRGKIDEVRSRSAPVDAKTSVELVFEHDGSTYRIERSLTDAKMFVGGSVAPSSSGSREVGRRVEQIIGMSLEEFVSTYCAEQKGLEFLSGMRGAAERERFIVRMMGYDRFEQIQELLRIDKREKKLTLAGFEAGVGDREQLVNRLELEKLTLAATQEKYDQSGRALVSAEKEEQLARELFLRHEDLRVRHEAHDKILAERVAKLNDRVAQKERLANQCAASRELAQSGTTSLYASFNDAERLRNLYEAELTQLKDAERSRSDSWRDELATARALCSQLSSRRLAEQEKSQKFDTLDADSGCPTCGQGLGLAFEGVKLVHDQLCHDLNSAWQSAQARLTELEPAPDDLQSLRSHISELTRRLQGVLSELTRFREIETLVQQMTLLEEQARGVAGEVEILTRQVSELRAQLTEIGFSQDFYLGAKGRLEASARLVEVSRLQRVRVEGELATQAALCARTGAEIEQFESKMAQLSENRKALKLMEESDELLSLFRKHLNASIKPTLAELGSEFLADLTDGRYTSIELGADYTPQVIEDGTVKPVISGGEQDVLNLCLRLALSQMLAERAGHTFALLILDEVFGSLDTQRRGNVLNLLEKLAGRFEQILVITHLDDIKDAVQNVVYVEYDEGSGTARVLEEAGLDAVVNL